MFWRKENIWWILLVITVGIITYVLPKNTPPTHNYAELINSIDSLNNELDLLQQERDSLQIVIDSAEVKVKVINNWYEKELVNITNQSIVDDVVFFTEYLSKANK